MPSGRKNIAISSPITSAFIITGGNIESRGIPLNLIFLKKKVSSAAITVAEVPKIISSGLNDAIFAIKQPTATPGIAADVNTGKIVSTSETRNCTGPKARLKILLKNVRSTYKAAISAPVIM